MGKTILLMTLLVCAIQAKAADVSYDIAPAKQVQVVDVTAGLVLDKYGGSLAVSGTATGWFAVQKIGDRWWLITPEGHGMVSLGVVHVLQAKEQPIFKSSYNGDTLALTKDATDNLRRWGFNSLGYGGINKRSSPEMAREMPFVLSMEDLLGISRFSAKPERPDLFAESGRQLLAGRIAENITPVKEEKNLIGYFYVDVPLWWNRTVRKQGNDWAIAYRKLPAESPGKSQYVDFLLQRRQSVANINQAYGTQAADRAALLQETTWANVNLDEATVLEDDHAFVAVVARQYYKLCQEEIRKLDPHHLIFGDRFSGAEIRNLEGVLKEAAPYIDGVAIQSFDKDRFNTALFDQVASTTGKPVLICDFAVNFATPEYPKGMWQTYPTEDAAADAYEQYVNEAFARPYMIGLHRCTYIDRPREGVLKQGLIQQSGQPYVRTVQRTAEAHKKLYQKLYGSGPDRP